MFAIALAAAAAAAVVCLFILYQQRHRRPRAAAIRELGENLDLLFSDADPNVLEQLKFFKIYDAATRELAARNVLRSKTRPPEFCVFDYVSLVGTQKASTRVDQTVFYFRDPRMKLPGFRLFPKKSDILKRNDTVIKYRSVSFPSNPLFSHAYRLIGPDGDEVRELFKPDLVSYLEKLHGLHIEGFDTELLLYLYKRVIPEKDFLRWYQNAQSIFQLFLHHSALFRAKKLNVS